MNLPRSLTAIGACHCGAVRFECDLDLSAGTSRCNCTFCKKNRYWMALVKEGDFRLLSGAEVLTDYRHTPAGMTEPFLHLTFCSRCGVRPFGRGGVLPQLGSAFYAVNVASLDDVSDTELAQLPVSYVDGRNNDWNATPKETRHL